MLEQGGLHHLGDEEHEEEHQEGVEQGVPHR